MTYKLQSSPTDMVDSCQEKIVSLTLFMGFGFILAPGHKQGRDLVVRRLIILIFAGSTA